MTKNTTEEKPVTKWSHLYVSLFVPNLIGYARFVTLAVSFYYALDKAQWQKFCFFYSASYGLDALDGRAARMFDQCSRYGAALDMICDRASNASMYMVLSSIFPDQSFAFYLCFLLDFGSHWLQF